LPGATIHDVGDGLVLATCGEDGRARLEDPELSQLAVRAAGHLLGFFPANDHELGRMREEARATGRVEIRLEPDPSIRFLLRFVAPDRSVVSGVRCRFELLGNPPMEAGASVWRAHSLAVQLPSFQSMGSWHLGSQSANRVYQGGETLEVLFAWPGVYRCRGAGGEHVVDREIVVHGAQRDALVLPLELGRHASGVVVSSTDGARIPGVEIRVRSGPLGDLETTTDAEGAYRVGPLTGAPIELSFEHLDFEPLLLERRPPGQDLRTALVARSVTLVRGRVQAAARRQPIVGARIEIIGRPDVVANTDPQGWFEFRANHEDLHLRVSAAGFLTYEEILERIEHQIDIELVPSSVDARLTAGCSALVAGVVRGRDGTPRGGVPVRIELEAPRLTGLSGRLILTGRIPSVEPFVLTSDDGSYSLECTVAGPARVVAVDGVVGPGEGRAIDIVLGRRHTCIDLSILR
jgi:hypothetical protein